MCVAAVCVCMCACVGRVAEEESTSAARYRHRVGWVHYQPHHACPTPLPSHQQEAPLTYCQLLLQIYTLSFSVLSICSIEDVHMVVRSIKHTSHAQHILCVALDIVD